MYTVGQPCPRFRVRTPAGLIGPADFRGEWLGLLHCTRPCPPGCAACMQRFDSLALRLRDRGCRLLVALDEPDAAMAALMLCRAEVPGSTWVLGRWEGAAEGPGSATRFVVLDQHGTVKAVAETPASGPIRGQMLLDLVDRACGRPAVTTSEELRGDATIGCVDWYDFEARPH